MFLSCSRCGYMFKSAYSFAGIKNVSLKGNREQCPRCKETVNTPDGTFSFDKFGIATLLSEPSFTKEVLRELKEVTERAHDNRYTPEQFREEAEKISPAVTQLFNSEQFRNLFWNVAKSSATGNFIAFLGFLLAVIMYIDAKKRKGAGAGAAFRCESLPYNQ